MASSCPILALDSVGRLDRELTTVARYIDDLIDRLRSDARALLLVNSLANAIVTAQQLRRHVLRATDSATTKHSIDVHERALRARLNIAMRALYTLKSNEPEIPATAFAGRFGGFRDVCVYLGCQLSQIHQRWAKQRATYQRLDAWTQQTLAYQSLDDAEISIERLGRDSDLERFLCVGVTSACEAVSLACEELAATMGVALAPGDGAAAKQPTECLTDRTAS